MAVETQCYISCDECGQLLAEDGKTVYGETEDCVRSEAVDLGWSCNVENNEYMPDLCSSCLPKDMKNEAQNDLENEL